MGYKTKIYKWTNKTNKLIDRDSIMMVTGEEEGCGEDNEGRIYGDRMTLDFGWWAHSGIYRWCIIKLNTWNLYNVINQCYSNKFNLKKNCPLCFETFLKPSSRKTKVLVRTATKYGADHPKCFLNKMDVFWVAYIILMCLACDMPGTLEYFYSKGMLGVLSHDVVINYISPFKVQFSTLLLIEFHHH